MSLSIQLTLSSDEGPMERWSDGTRGVRSVTAAAAAPLYVSGARLNCWPDISWTTGSPSSRNRLNHTIGGMRFGHSVGLKFSVEFSADWRLGKVTLHMHTPYVWPLVVPVGVPQLLSLPSPLFASWRQQWEEDSRPNQNGRHRCSKRTTRSA